jgi:hypothetical protein
MNITIELTGTLEEIQTEMKKFIGNDNSALDDMTLQEVLTYASGRATAEGYDFEVIKPGDRLLSAAEQRREEARAKLRGDLEASLKGTSKTEEPKLEPTPEPKKAEPKKAEPKKAEPKSNGAKAAETPEQRKDRCLERLMDLYTDPKMVPVVRKILAEHGDGAKNFRVVPEENFEKISAVLEALEN